MGERVCRDLGLSVMLGSVCRLGEVFAYIPPNGELRGGAWVVIDPTINEEMMEMYVDNDARGGILEPPGICDVRRWGGGQENTGNKPHCISIPFDGAHFLHNPS